MVACLQFRMLPAPGTDGVEAKVIDTKHDWPLRTWPTSAGSATDPDVPAVPAA